MSAPVRLPPRPKPFKCDTCPPSVKDCCEWFGCPFNTALDAPGPVFGRSPSLIAARMGATGRTA
jgi:hypothetical protein